MTGKLEMGWLEWLQAALRAPEKDRICKYLLAVYTHLTKIGDDKIANS